VALTASVYDVKGRVIDQATFVQRNGEHATVLASFPGLGNYRVVLFAKKPGVKPDRYESVISIAVEYSGADNAMPAYPLLYDSYYEMGCELISPLAGIVTRGSEMEFSIRIPGGREASFASGKTRFSLQKKSDEIFVYSGPAPGGSELTIFALDKGNRWAGILRYMIQ
jgi:hypothetical protein